jgi:hypothetical protein
MRVTEYLKQHPITGTSSTYDDIPGLLSAALQSGRYPPPLPLPPPRNAITGFYPNPVDGFRLELSALSRGYDRALFITSADAAFLSLRPKPDEKPVLSSFRSPGGGLFLQYLFLLDSFDGGSFSRLYSFANPRSNKENNKSGLPLPPAALGLRNSMAARALYFSAANDTALEAGRRVTMAREYKQNSSPASPAFALTGNFYKTCVSNIPSRALKAFDFLRKYHAQAITSLNILGANGADDAVKQSFSYLSKTSPDEVLPVIFFASSFASRLCGAEILLAPERPRAVQMPPSRRQPAASDTPIDDILRS